MTFGERLRELRKERNMTQEDLGKYLGVTDRAIGYYEAGRLPPEDLLLKLADYFYVPMDYLMGRSDVRLLSEEDPIPQEWVEGVAFIRRAGTVLTEHEKQDLLDLAKTFIRSAERRKRQQEGMES